MKGGDPISSRFHKLLGLPNGKSVPLYMIDEAARSKSRSVKRLVRKKK